MAKTAGVTLVELMVVLAVIAILLGLSLPAMISARAAARRTQCASNLRQFHEDYHSPYDSERKYMRAVNLCPSANESMGYFSNDLIVNPALSNSTTTTIEYFEHAGGSLVHGAPRSPNDWFSPANVRNGNVLPLVRDYVAIDRHVGRTANYLYLDGHVAVIPAEAIEAWVAEAHNFGLEGNGAYP